jgi:phosphate uptake regulator
MPEAPSSEGEIRKLQETGRASYIVSLPKKWVQDLGLRKGSPVRATRQEDGSLILSSGQVMPRQRLTEIVVEVNPDQDPQSLARKLIALYLTGLNTMVLKSRVSGISPRVRDVARNLVRTKLVGTEIVSESSSELVMQVLLSYPELSVESALRRMVTIADQMHRDSVTALCEGKSDLAAQVIKSDDEVDRFGFYIVRLLKHAVEDPRLVKEIGLKSPRDCLGYRLIAKSVERIADHSAMIAQHSAKLEEALASRLAARIKDLSEFCSSLFQDATQALFRNDYSMADKVLVRQERAHALEAEIEKHIYRQNLSPEETSELRLILESLRRIGEYGADVAEIVLNLTVSKESIQ